MACGCDREEAGVDVLAQLVPLGFVEADVELGLCCLNLMVRAPVIWESRAQRGKHAGLVLSKIHHTLRHSGDTQHEHIALFLQSSGVGHVRDNVVETREHLTKPQVLTETHHCSVELQHLYVRGRQIRIHATLTLLSFDTLIGRLIDIVVRGFRASRRRDKVRHLAADIPPRVSLCISLSWDSLTAKELVLLPWTCLHLQSSSSAAVC